MKSLLSKYWKRILIVLTVVLVSMNMIKKWTAPHILIDEYAKYGPDVQNMLPNIGAAASEMISDVQEASPFDEKIFGWIIAVIALLLIAMLIGDLAERKPSTNKK